MALIIARPGSFLIIADSYTNDGVTFSKTTQKTFISNKHHIGLCIAGEANLTFPGWSREEDVLYVDYVFKEFFEYIDTLDACPIDNLQTLLDAFMVAHYASYIDWLREKVGYYYGGFTSEGLTKIFAHHIKEDGEVECQSYTYAVDGEDKVFFCNTDAVQIVLDEAMEMLSPNKEFTEKQYLTMSKFQQQLEAVIVPEACRAINGLHRYSIGDHLFIDTMTAAANAQRRCLQYYDDPDDPSNPPLSAIVRDNSLVAPAFQIYRTLLESNEAFLDGSHRKYHLTNGKRCFPPEIKIQAVVRSFLFRKHHKKVVVAPQFQAQGPNQPPAPGQ